MPTSNTITHDQDFSAWAFQNAELLRQGRLLDCDAANIAEELDSMGRSVRRELASRLRILLMHLLKWRYQPERRGTSWRLTIRNQRTEIRDLLKENPSLSAQLPNELDANYADARELAMDETGLPESTFPNESPFSLEETLNQAFWPD